MRAKKLISVLAIVLLILMVVPLTVGAASAYQTYTYSIDGEVQWSPDAYAAKQSVDSAYMGLEVPLKTPNDLITDDANNVYIADTGNNRIVVLDRYFKLKMTIGEFINDQGVPDSLNAPQGVFISSDRIWVCDTGSSRIVIFDREGNYLRILEAPESSLFDNNAIYKPVAMAVDQYNRLYVVSSSTYQGIIVLDEDGNFQNFIGAQAVSITFWQIIWRRFQTEEQRALTKSFVSTEFNNIALDQDGNLYVTTSSIKEQDLADAITAGQTDGKNLPVKLLNSKGDEIMRRNGFWPPAGEIQYTTVSSEEIFGPSTIVDVACGPEQTWSIIDSKRSKIYTYDYDGNLLFAFGDNTSMLGSVTTIRAITYQGSRMLVLDSSNLSVMVYERTEYGDLLLEAIAAQNNLNYDYAIECWKRVLQHNSNFDAAYVGIGQAYYRAGDYKQAMQYFEIAYETKNWSNSYKEVRKDWMASWLPLTLLVLIIVIVLIAKALKHVGKVNAAVAVAGRKTKYVEELYYGFHVIMHPFDGFWDLKHEKRGSMRAALTFLGLTILAFFYQNVGSGYVFNPYRNHSPIWVVIISVVLPLGLFMLANWCLTTLFDGEGSLKDIFIASCYALLPIVLILIPSTILSNFLTESEAGIVTFLNVVSYVWAGLLLVFGLQVTHDYLGGKNLITILGTIIGMAFIMFVATLFTTLLIKLVSLITNIVQEIQYRL